MHAFRDDLGARAANSDASHHELSRAMFACMLENGILMVLPDSLHAAISYAHTENDIDHLIGTVERYVKANN